ncbi:MAG: hypothetical protein ACREBI_05355 [Nitrosotalea sp.]
MTEDPFNGYTESIPSNDGCDADLQPFNVMTCTITNSDVPPDTFFDNFDGGTLASTGWSLPFLGCDSGPFPCIGQSTTNEFGQPAPSPPFWAVVGALPTLPFCPPLFVSSSKSFTLSQSGNYDVKAVLSPSECQGCTEHAQLYLDGSLTFDAPGILIGITNPPTIVNEDAVVNLSAGSHTVMMASTSNAACSGYFRSYFDDIAIQPTNNPTTSTPVGGPYFTLQVNQTSFNVTSGSTTVVPLKVIWNPGWNAEPVSAAFMGNTTSVVPSMTSVANTTSYQLFNVTLNVPSNTQTGNYYVGIQIAEPDGDSQVVPMFVRVQ